MPRVTSKRVTKAAARSSHAKTSFPRSLQAPNSNAPLMSKKFKTKPAKTGFLPLEAAEFPMGMTSCPYPDCRSHHKVFRPHWRVREHLRNVHGYARLKDVPKIEKATAQSSTAKSGLKRKRPLNGTLASVLPNTDQDAVTVKRNTLLLDPSCVLPTSLVTANRSVPSSVSDSLESDMDGSNDEDNMAIEAPHPPGKRVKVGTRPTRVIDHDMIARIHAFATSLTSINGKDIDLNTKVAQLEKAKLLFQSLVDDPPLLNSKITSRRLEILLPLYKKLSQIGSSKTVATPMIHAFAFPSSEGKSGTGEGQATVSSSTGSMPSLSKIVLLSRWPKSDTLVVVLKLPPERLLSVITKPAHVSATKKRKLGYLSRNAPSLGPLFRSAPGQESASTKNLTQPTSLDGNITPVTTKGMKPMDYSRGSARSAKRAGLLKIKSTAKTDTSSANGAVRSLVVKLRFSPKGLDAE